MFLNNVCLAGEDFVKIQLTFGIFRQRKPCEFIRITQKKLFTRFLDFMLPS